MEKEVFDFLLNNIKNWCAYQERCQQDVRDKLYILRQKISLDAIDEIITILITENYINEERFAVAFAGGKFRIKKWGRIKIKTQLKQRQISDYSIKKALSAIDPDEYFNTMKEVVLKKRSGLRGESDKIRFNYKLLRYAQSRGFETDLILEVLKDI